MKFVSSHVNTYEETCTVFIEIKGKIYSAIAIKNKDDPTPFNQYFGCRVAEMKAKQKYLKERKLINRYKKEAIESLIKDALYNNKDIHTVDDLFKIISRHENYYKKEMQNKQDEIDLIKNTIKKDCEKRLEIHKKQADKKK